MKNTFYFLFSLLILGFTNFSLSQNIEIYKGQELSARQFGSSTSVLYHNDNETVTFDVKTKAIGRSSFQISIFDNRLNLVQSNELEFPNKDMKYERILEIKGKMFLFMTTYDRNEKTTTLYGTTVNKHAQMGGKVYELGVFDAKSKRNNVSFNFSNNEDSTKILVSILPSYERTEKQSVRFLTYNMDFMELENLEFQFPYLDRDFKLDKVLMDRFENIHILGITTKREKSSIFKPQDRTASLYSYYKGASELKEYKIGIDEEEGEYLNQITLGTDKNGLLHCAGFYSDNRFPTMKGIFVFTLDLETQSIKNVKSQQFTEDFINQFLTERQQKRKERAKDRGKDKFSELNNLVVRDLLWKEGGGFYFIAEYYYYYVTTNHNAQTGATTYTHHYNYRDIMVADVKEDNSVNWLARIPKIQNTVNDGGRFSGIAYLLTGDNTLNIIFNDHANNANVINPPKRLNFNIRKGVTVLVQIDKDGNNPIKMPLISNKKERYILAPKRFASKTSNELVMIATRGKKFRFMRIAFK